MGIISFKCGFNTTQEDAGFMQEQGALSGKQKLGAVGLVVLAVFIIYLGFRQIDNNIKGPFGKSFVYTPANTNTDSAEAQLAVLKGKDTDHDGLSDYDELYIYHTSPYLADTDSDGIPDGTEVKNGTDPNCPEGQKCGTYEATAQPSATSTLSLPVASPPSADQVLLQSLFGSNPDPKLLREFALKQGMDKKVLDALTDDEIIKIFQDTVTAPANANATANVNASVTPSGATAASTGITAQDLRTLLESQGVSKADLDKVSDAELLQAFSENNQ